MSASNRWWRDYDAECDAWDAGRLRTRSRSYVEFSKRVHWTCSHCNASGVGGYHGCGATGRYVFNFFEVS